MRQLLVILNVLILAVDIVLIFIVRSAKEVAKRVQKVLHDINVILVQLTVLSHSIKRVAHNRNEDIQHNHHNHKVVECKN
jgi:hypothetical protein